jgi:hypothetical protein
MDRPRSSDVRCVERVNNFPDDMPGVLWTQLPNGAFMTYDLPLMPAPGGAQQGRKPGQSLADWDDELQAKKQAAMVAATVQQCRELRETFSLHPLRGSVFLANQQPAVKWQRTDWPWIRAAEAEVWPGETFRHDLDYMAGRDKPAPVITRPARPVRKLQIATADLVLIFCACFLIATILASF